MNMNIGQPYPADYLPNKQIQKQPQNIVSSSSFFHPSNSNIQSHNNNNIITNNNPNNLSSSSNIAIHPSHPSHPLHSNQHQHQHLHQPSMHPPIHPAQTTRHQFQDLLTCHICFCHVTLPMMCPYCSKLYCQNCIKKCLQFKPQCPNCRKQIKSITNMASCNRFVNQLEVIVNQIIEMKVQQEICAEHQVQINYYCQQCSQPICCQCHMFGKHQQHRLKKLSVVYQARYQVLRDMLTEFKTKLKEKQMGLKDIQNQLTELKKLKEKNLKELEDFTEQYRVKIMQQTTKQTNQIQQSVNKYNEILSILNKLQQQLNIKAQQAQKSGTFTLDQQLVKKIQNQLKVQLPKVQIKPKSVLQQVIPPFFQSRFVVTNFSKKKKDRSTIFSPTQKCQGSQWRLKIYPNGNNNFQNNFLSIFIQMVSTIHQSTIYQYQIQLVNRINPNQSTMRESSSTFEPGQSWGYNKFIKLQNLQRDGFLDPVTDQLQIRYFIRNPFYYNIYKQKEVYIQYLDSQLGEQEAEIIQLQRLINGNGENADGVGINNNNNGNNNGNGGDSNGSITSK